MQAQAHAQEGRPATHVPLPGQRLPTNTLNPKPSTLNPNSLESSLSRVPVATALYARDATLESDSLEGSLSLVVQVYSKRDRLRARKHHRMLAMINAGLLFLRKT